MNAAASRGGTAGADTWRQRKERDARAAGADAGTMLAEDDGNMDVTATSCSPNWEYFSSDGSGQKLTCILEKCSIPNTSCSLGLDGRTGQASEVFAVTYSTMRLTDRMVTLGVTLLPPGKKWLYLALSCWGKHYSFVDVDADDVSDECEELTRRIGGRIECLRVKAVKYDEELTALVSRLFSELNDVSVPQIERSSEHVCVTCSAEFDRRQY